MKRMLVLAVPGVLGLGYVPTSACVAPWLGFGDEGAELCMPQLSLPGQCFTLCRSPGVGALCSLPALLAAPRDVLCTANAKWSVSN